MSRRQRQEEGVREVIGGEGEKCEEWEILSGDRRGRGEAVMGVGE